MKLLEIADQIFRELGEPSNLSLASITAWLQYNLGTLNNLICSNYSLTSGLQADPELGINEASVYKQLYQIHFFERLVATSSGASSYDWVSITEGDSSLKRVSKTDQISEWRRVTTQLKSDLKDLVRLYKINQSQPYSINEDLGLIAYTGVYPEVNGR